MPKKGVKKGSTGQSVSKGKKAPSPEIYAAIEASVPGMSKKQLNICSGYAPGTNTSQIKSTDKYRKALVTVAERRERLMDVAGIRFEDQLKRLNRIVHDRLYTTEQDEQGKKVKVKKDVPPAVMVAASKQIAEQMAYNAPQQVEIEQRGLLLSFNDLGSKDLTQLREAITQ